VKESVHLMGTDYIVQYDVVSDKLVVNEEHGYYHQIQGQLFLTKRSLCYLVIYVSNDMEYVEIPRNDSWASNIPKLIEFWDKQVMSSIIQ